MTPAALLIGRTAERAALQAVLAQLGDGLSAALVLRGEPGVGKSAMVRDLISSARGFECAVLTGLETESRLAYAGLHRLLVPYRSRIDQLPTAQRIALRTALGLIDGPPSTPFLVGLAVLTLLAEVAQAVPVLCVVDDAQWLDLESLGALAFVARRLYAERLALVFTVREPPRNDVLDGIPEINLEGLPPEVGAELLRVLAAVPLDRHLAVQLSELAGGNPLVLREIARELARGRALPGLLLHEPIPVGQRLENHYRNRIQDLPADCRAVLLLAAADGDDDPRRVWRAAKLAGLPPEAALPAEAEQLVDLTTELTFRHPLIRAAVYRLAEPADRRHAHDLLASATDAVVDPDVRAWHLARSRVEPDELVAAALERSAARARARGGLLAEADFLARSAELSPEISQAARRTLVAAQSAIAGGAPLRAAAILTAGERYFGDPISAARALTLRQRIRYLSGETLDQIPLTLLGSARIFAPTDPQLTRRTLLHSVELAFATGHLISGITGPEVGRAALALRPPPERDQGLDDLLLTALATLAGIGYVAAAPLLRRVVEAMASPSSLSEGVPEWFVDGIYAAHALWDDRARRDWLERGERASRTSGALHSLQLALVCLATVEAQTGQLRSAQARTEDSLRLAESIGWSAAKVAVLANPELLAWRGFDREATAAAESLHAAANHLRADDINRPGYRALMVMHLGHGHYQDAFDVANRMRAQDSLHFDNDALPTLVEAGVRSRHVQTAAAALAELTERATASNTRWAAGLLARCRALMSDDPELDYQSSITELEKTTVISDLARSHLLYGEWLRRTKRKVDARHHLRTAFDLFTDMGAVAFTDRATIELRATGERPVANSAERTGQLTPHEAQVVQLAADGATDQMIATELFISTHTVGYHLRKAFRKLGVTSRSQLHLVLKA